MPCNAAPFVLARVVPYAKKWEDEDEIAESFRRVGILVAMGRSYHVPEKGWARICFAVEQRCLEEALGRMEGVLLSVTSRGTENS